MNKTRRAHDNLYSPAVYVCTLVLMIFFNYSPKFTAKEYTFLQINPKVQKNNVISHVPLVDAIW